MKFIAILMLLITGSCTTYEVTGLRISKFTADDAFRKVGIGFFESAGPNGVRTQRNFQESLAFSLQEKGYQIVDAGMTRDLLTRAELASDRVLSQNEILQFAGRYPGRILLQGRIQETRTEKLVESRLQVMIQLHFHDLRTGERLGEILLFGRDLDFNTARETMIMAQKTGTKLDELLAAK